MVKGFTLTKVLFSNDGSEGYKVSYSTHYTWNEHDEVYYSDIIDEVYLSHVPANGFKTYVLKVNAHARMLVKLD